MYPGFTICKVESPPYWDADTIMFRFIISNEDIIFWRLPSYVVIRGDEKADFASKSALDLPHVKIRRLAILHLEERSSTSV